MKDTVLRHSISTSTKNNAQRFSHNSIQGHYHSEYGIMYSADSNQLRWSMTVGCFLDPRSVAAKYAATAVLKRPILGCGMLIGGAVSRLVISDLHIPYHHKDAADFLYELDKFYGFDEIICTGDLLDHHRGSYHESEPAAMGEEEEYAVTKQYAQEFQEIFPDMIISCGNHDEIPKRKLKTVGLPSSMVSDYNALYDLSPSGWKWVDEYRFDSAHSLPVLCPMVLTKAHRWNGKILKV